MGSHAELCGAGSAPPSGVCQPAQQDEDESAPGQAYEGRELNPEKIYQGGPQPESLDQRAPPRVPISLNNEGRRASVNPLGGTTKFT